MEGGLGRTSVAAEQVPSADGWGVRSCRDPVSRFFSNCAGRSVRAVGMAHSWLVVPFPSSQRRRDDSSLARGRVGDPDVGVYVREVRATQLSSERTRVGWEPRTRFADRLARTVDRYHANAWWRELIRSGDYRAYYEGKYGRQLR